MNDKPPSFEFPVIGYIESCFKQKFGIPRQSGLVEKSTAILALLPEYSHPDIVRGLDEFSHIWILFVFHESRQKSKTNTVRPPRLGGSKRLGVFATRSNFRPSPIGQSVVRLDKLEFLKDQINLHLLGIDILNNTPVLDIKPYIPYADAIPSAKPGFAASAPERKFSVEFSDQSYEKVVQHAKKLNIDLMHIIKEMLSFDPRPGYLQKSEGSKQYHIRLYDLEISWQVSGNRVVITTVIE